MPVDEHAVRNLVRRASELQHRRPEQRVEVDDVLADEVNLLGVRGRKKLLIAAQLARRAGLAALEVALE